MSRAAAQSGPTRAARAAWGVQLDGVGDPLVEVVDLGGQLQDPAGQQPQRPGRGAGGVAGWVRGQLRALADEDRVLRPDSASRSAGSAATKTALSWLIAWVRDLIAEPLASLNIRSISTGPSPVLAVAVARPDSTAWAAAWASMVSVLPRRRWVALSGWLTSMTLMPAARRCRASALPWEPVHSTPARRSVPKVRAQSATGGSRPWWWGSCGWPLSRPRR